MCSLKISRYVYLIIPFLLVSCGSVVFRNQSPAFSIIYPSNWIEMPKRVIDSVLCLRGPLMFIPNTGYRTVGFIEVNIEDLPKDMKLDDAPKLFVGHLKDQFPKSRGHEILKHEMITLNDGTRAIETSIKWQWSDGTDLKSINIKTIKDKKHINVTGTVTSIGDIEDVENIVRSLEIGERKVAQQKDTGKKSIAQRKEVEPERIKTEQQKESNRRAVVRPDLTGDSNRVAVMDFKANGISQLIASNISELVRNELIIMGSFVVLERSQVDQILKEQGFQMTGCTETSCAVKVGQLLSAKKILIGTVMKMGNMIVISGRIVDIEKGIGEKAANQNVTSIDELGDAAGKFTRTLIGQ